MMQHIFTTVHSGIPVLLEDGSISRTLRTERTFVIKTAANQYSWKDHAGRICTAETSALFPSAAHNLDRYKLTT